MSNPYYLSQAQQPGQKGQQPVMGQPIYHQPHETSTNQINVKINTHPKGPSYHPPPPPKMGMNAKIGNLGVNIQLGAQQGVNKRCNVCQQQTQTVLKYKYGKFIWLACIVLFFVSVCLFWVPFCIDDWKDKQYKCLRCGSIKAYHQGRLC